MNKTRATFFVILGIVSIVLGIVTFTLDPGSIASNERYGGDAYTGIQQASAATARNVFYQSKILKFALGSLLLVGGLAMMIGSIPPDKEIEEATSSLPEKDENKPKGI